MLNVVFFRETLQRFPAAVVGGGGITEFINPPAVYTSFILQGVRRPPSLTSLNEPIEE